MTNQQAAYERVQSALQLARDGYSDKTTGVALYDAALRDLETLAPRDGWVLVPVEPTETQLDRGVSFSLNTSISSQNGGWSEYIRTLYRILLSAAPQPIKREVDEAIYI